MEAVAGEFREKAIDEVVETERSRSLARVSQVVDYIFYVIYALLAIRLLLALPIVIAIIAYALVHAGINGLLRLIARRKTEI